MRQLFLHAGPIPLSYFTFEGTQGSKIKYYKKLMQNGFIESLFNFSFRHLLCLLQAKKGQKSDVYFLQKMEKQGIKDHSLVWIGLIKNNIRTLEMVRECAISVWYFLKQMCSMFAAIFGT